MVAIRSAGLALESLIGVAVPSDPGTDPGTGTGVLTVRRTVPRAHLRTLLRVANERFAANAERIARFRALLLSETGTGAEGAKRKSDNNKKGDGGAEWEDAAVRRERLRAEGLRRREEVRREREREGKDGQRVDDDGDVLHVDDLTLGTGET